MPTNPRVCLFTLSVVIVLAKIRYHVMQDINIRVIKSALLILSVWLQMTDQMVSSTCITLFSYDKVKRDFSGCSPLNARFARGFESGFLNRLQGCVIQMFNA